MVKENKEIIAKPFIKWAGGKNSLIKVLTEHLPEDFKEQQDVTYIEPFVGGGAMLFYMLTHYHNIRHAIINDVNEDLINCYKIIKNEPQKLIKILRKIKDEYYELQSIDDKSKYYYKMRGRYNNDEFGMEERSACFIFLNKTCFNGLYRVNTSGKFNVPFGKYEKQNICDEELIMTDHKLLKKVDIYSGNYYEITYHFECKYNFVYIDPPYRPLSNSAHFIEYTHNIFDDTEQEKLKVYCDLLSQKGYKIMQSNSNSIDSDGIPFFTKLYTKYNIYQIKAHRFINAHAGKREKETELLITNYNIISNNANI